MTRSYSHENASGMPGGPARMDAKADEARSAFERAASAEPTPAVQPQGSQMIKEDAPRPAPRPSPGMAYGADATAHQHRLQMDRERAEKHMVGGNLDREARKAAFKAERNAGEQGRDQSRDR